MMRAIDMRNLFRSVLFISAFFAVAAPAQADLTQISARVDVERYFGYTRMIIEWPRDTITRAYIKDGDLIVRFSRPFVGDFEGLKQQADHFASDLSLRLKGRELRFKLREAYRLHESQSGDAIALDIIHPSYAGDPLDYVSPAALVEDVNSGV